MGGIGGISGVPNSILEHMTVQTKLVCIFVGMTTIKVSGVELTDDHKAAMEAIYHAVVARVTESQGKFIDVARGEINWVAGDADDKIIEVKPAGSLGGAAPVEGYKIITEIKEAANRELNEYLKMILED